MSKIQINKGKMYQFSELTSKNLNDLIKTLTDQQKFIPDNTICAMPSSVYGYHEDLKDFIEKKEPNTLLCIGYSSGGARKHTIYCNTNGTFFVIFQTVDRGTRIYYLTTWILKDLLKNDDSKNEENNEENNQENNDYTEVINNFVNPDEIKNLHVTKTFG